MVKDIEIDGNSLTIDEIVQVARNGAHVKISEKAIKKMEASSAWVKKVLQGKALDSEGTPLKVFGINRLSRPASDRTGSHPEETDCLYPHEFSHREDQASSLPQDTVRAFLLLRANSLAKGHAGVRPVIVQTLVAMLNNGVHPFIPDGPLLGCDGDLMPPNDLLNLLHEEKNHQDKERDRIAMVSSQAADARQAMKKAGIKRIPLEGVETSALCNSHQIAVAMTVMLLHDMQRMMNVAEASAALAVEALRGAGTVPPGGAQASPLSNGKSITEKHISTLLKGSTFILSQTDREPDANSLRCIYEILGNLRNLTDYASAAIGAVLNAAADNPYIIPEKKEPDRVFFLQDGHGYTISQICDCLKLGLVQVGQSAERRVYRMSNRHLSGTTLWIQPEKLDFNRRPDLHNLHALCVALSAKNSTLAHPAVLDNLSGGTIRDDYVSNAFLAVKNALAIKDNIDFILGLELLSAATMILYYSSKGKKLKPGVGSNRIIASLKKIVTLSTERGYTTEELEEVVASLRDGDFSNALPGLFK